MEGEAALGAVYLACVAVEGTAGRRHLVSRLGRRLLEAGHGNRAAQGRQPSWMGLATQLGEENSSEQGGQTGDGPAMDLKQAGHGGEAAVGSRGSACADA